MAANSTLVLVIQADTAQANSAVKATGSTFVAFESQAVKSALGASRSMENFEKSAIRAAVNVQNRFSAFGGVLGANVVSGFSQKAGELSIAGFKIAASFERSRISLEAFLGSAEQADKLFNQIQSFALKSPFEFKDLLIGANRLLAFDFAAKEIVPTLSAVSASVGALGGDIGKVNDLIAALGQIRQAGKLTGEELRQLRNAGVEGTAIKALGDAYGLTAAQVNKAVRDGIIPGVDAVTIIVKALDEKYNPLLEKVSKTTEVSLSNVKDSFGKASEQAFKPFLADINSLAKQAGPQLEKFGILIRDNAGTIRSFAEGVGVLGLALLAAKIPASIAAITLAVQGLSAAAIANPWGLLAAGVVGLGFVLAKGQQNLTDYADSVESKLVTSLARQGKSVAQIVEELKKYNDEAAKMEQQFGDQAFGTPRLEASAERVQKLLAELPENKLKKSVEDAQKSAALFNEQEKKAFRDRLDAQKKLAGEETARKAVSDAEGQARKLLNDALKGQLTSLGKIGFELAENLILYGKSAKAIEDLGKASKVSFETELRRASGKKFEEAQGVERKRIDELQKARLASEAETLQQSLDLRKQTIERANEFQFRELERARDRELEQLGQIDESTLQGKALIEQRKLEIESSYLEQAAVLRLDGIDRETQVQIAKYQAFVNAKLISEEAFVQVRDALLRESGERARDVEAEFISEIELLRLKSANKSAQVQRDLIRDTFNDIKRSAGSVFDQFVRDAKGVFGTIGALLKTALLTPIKEVFTDEVARLLTPALAQIRGARGGGGSAGGVAGLFSLLGQRSAFGQVANAVGGPGGTGGFAGPVSAASIGLGSYGSLPQIIGANGQPVNIGSGGAGAVGQLGALAGAKGLLTQLGQIGATSKLFSGGIYGAKGGALLAGGGILAADGLRRGGLVGTLETAAGGALIGAKFGGPIGALIGGAIGLGAGLIRNLFKSANEKAREKIKTIYGVDISSTQILGQVVAVAKQTFGGDLDLAIRSSDIRDLVELYALSTGQSARGIAAKIQPVTLSTSGGVTGILQNYSNGQPMSIGSSQAAGPTVIQVTLDGASSAAFLQGQTVNAIESNPRAVAGASAAAQQSNLGRQQAAVSQLNPGLLLA
jgi:tape measure domain-containing protein